MQDTLFAEAFLAAKSRIAAEYSLEISPAIYCGGTGQRLAEEHYHARVKREGAGWFGMPSEPQEILILPIFTLRRSRFGSSSERSNQLKREVYRQYTVKFYG